MIREATWRDINAIWDLCVQAHAGSPYSGIPLDELLTRKLIQRFTTSPSHFCWVAHGGEALTGVLAASVEQIAWSHARQASDMLFYCAVPGDGARLVRRFIGWAKERNVALWGISVSFGGDLEKTHRLLTSCGLQHIGGIFIGLKQG